MNYELEKLMKWLQANRLSLNIKKTHFMFFSPPRKNLSFSNEIKIMGEKIEMVHETKFLGVMLDSKLSWQPHIAYISKKISKGIGILCKARKYLPQKCLMTLYYSFIYPYMNYCLEVWGKCTNDIFSKVFVLQKRAIRLIDNRPWRSPSKPIFDKLNILPLKKVFAYKIGIFMYKFNKISLPRIFDDVFKKTSQIHSHKTRITFHVPFTANRRTQRTIRYQGPTLGNYIFSKLNVSSHSWALFTFKTKLKKFLLKNEIEFL